MGATPSCPHPGYTSLVTKAQNLTQPPFQQHCSQEQGSGQGQGPETPLLPKEQKAASCHSGERACGVWKARWLLQVCGDLGIPTVSAFPSWWGLGRDQSGWGRWAEAYTLRLLILPESPNHKGNPQFLCRVMSPIGDGR